MSYRRFVIREVFDTFYDVTESEVKARLAAICNRSGPSDAIKLDGDDIRDEDIDTLLHGIPCACVYKNGKLIAPCAYHDK